METAENSGKSEKKKKKADQSRFSKMRRIWPGRRLGKTEKSCQVCFLPPASSDSPETASRSGKDQDEFCPDLVKALIEKNDFYSKDCNVHSGAYGRG